MEVNELTKGWAEAQRRRAEKKRKQRRIKRRMEQQVAMKHRAQAQRELERDPIKEEIARAGPHEETQEEAPQVAEEMSREDMIAWLKERKVRVPPRIKTETLRKKVAQLAC